MKKNFLVLVVIALIFSHIGFAQDSAGRSVLPAETDFTFNFDATTADGATSPSTVNQVNSYSGVGAFVRMFIVLAIVIALLVFVLRFMKKKMNPASNEDPYLKNVASLSLAPGKSVHVITLNRHAYIVGAAENSVSLIAEFNDDELVDAMNINAEANPAPNSQPRNFKDMLSKIIPMKTPSDTMKKHHDRLNSFNSEDK